jgi:hypothetical protein
VLSRAIERRYIWGEQEQEQEQEQEHFRKLMRAQEAFSGVRVVGSGGVDLNAVRAVRAVRAGIVQDPREWRWCGYAEAF